MTTTRTNEHLITSLSTHPIPFHEAILYKKEHDDHQVIIDTKLENVTIATASVQARRHINEDYMNVDFIPDFEKLSRSMQKIVLQSWINEIQKILREERKEDNDDDDIDPGSTACIAITWVNEKGILHNLTANLGDSHADAFIIQQSGDEKSHQLKGNPIKLSKAHKPEDSEKTRIEKEGGQLLWGRVNGELNISRALGDFKLSPFISDELTFEELTHTLDPHEKVVFFIACDGTDGMMKDDITFHQELLKNIPLDQTLKNLLKLSIDTDKRDNTSFIILCYSYSDKPQPAILSAVYDGHGSNKISKFVSENGLPILKNKIQLALTSEGVHQLIQEEKERMNSTRIRMLRREHFEKISRIFENISPSFHGNIKHDQMNVSITYTNQNEEKLKNILNKYPFDSSNNRMNKITFHFQISEPIPTTLIDCLVDIVKLMGTPSYSNKIINIYKKMLDFNKDSATSDEKAKPITITPVAEKSFLKNLFTSKIEKPATSFTVVPAKVDLVSLLSKLRTQLNDNKSNLFLSIALVPHPIDCESGLYRLTCKNKNAALFFKNHPDFRLIDCFDQWQISQGIFSSTQYYLYFTPKNLEFLNEILDSPGEILSVSEKNNK